MNRCTPSLLVACLALTWSSPLSAQLAQFHFSGRVQTSQNPIQEVQSPVSPWPGLTANVGDVVTGEFQFHRTEGLDEVSDPNISRFVETTTTLTIRLNGHTITETEFLLEINNDQAAHGGSDSVVLLGQNVEVEMDGQTITWEGGTELSIGLLFFDFTQSALDSAAPPSTIDPTAFSFAAGFCQRTSADGTVREGIEFGIDTLDRIVELHPGSHVAWPADVPTYLQVAETIEGPWLPFQGSTGRVEQQMVALITKTAGKHFYRLSPASLGESLSANFDNDPVGTAPDKDVPLGIWSFPDHYLDVTPPAGEPLAETVSIVPTSDFDPGTSGNSLQLLALRSMNAHLAGFLPEIIHESAVGRVVARFDLYVPSGDHGGCAIYLSGDHGGGGLWSTSDRGPQILFVRAQNQIYVTDQLGGAVPLGEYLRDTWQTVQLAIDLREDHFDLATGMRGETLTTLGTDLPFRSGSIRFIDRFSIVAFPFWNDWHAYVDNIVITLEP